MLPSAAIAVSLSIYTVFHHAIRLLSNKSITVKHRAQVRRALVRRRVWRVPGRDSASDCAGILVTCVFVINYNYYIKHTAIIQLLYCS